MTKTYFTLGQTHKHILALPEGEKVWDKDGVVCVESESVHVASKFIVLMFGHDWSDFYLSLDSDFYPKGVIHTYTIPVGMSLDPDDEKDDNEQQDEEFEETRPDDSEDGPITAAMMKWQREAAEDDNVKN